MDLSRTIAVAALPVASLNDASSWYRDHLGAVPAETNPGGSLYQCGGGTKFFMYESQFAGTNEATALMLQVPDLDEAIADLRSKGIRFEEYDFGELKTVDGVFTAPDGSRNVWFKDPDGNIIGVGTD